MKNIIVNRVELEPKELVPKELVPKELLPKVLMLNGLGPKEQEPKGQEPKESESSEQESKGLEPIVLIPSVPALNGLEPKEQEPRALKSSEQEPKEPESKEQEPKESKPNDPESKVLEPIVLIPSVLALNGLEPKEQESERLEPKKQESNNQEPKGQQEPKGSESSEQESKVLEPIVLIPSVPALNGLEPKEQESNGQESKELESQEHASNDQAPKESEPSEQESIVLESIVLVPDALVLNGLKPEEQESKEQAPSKLESKELEPEGQEPESPARLSPESVEVLRREVARDKRPSRKPDIMLTFLVLVLLAGIGFYLYRSGAVMGNRNPELDVHASVKGYVSYDLNEYVNKALARLEESQADEPATVYEAGESTQRKAALIFYGLGTAQEMDAILQKLNDYDVPAIFFADAMTLAENRDIIEMIGKNGYTVGTSGFTAIRKQEELSDRELVTNLAKSQAVFNTVPQGETQWYYGPGTEYTEQLLQSIPLAGVYYAVQPSCYLSASSFPSFSAAAGFLGRLNSCELICVKVSGVLEENEYQPYEVDAQVEIDKQPSVTLPQSAPPVQTDIVTTVGYLLEALDALQIPVVPVPRIGIDPDPQIDEQEVQELPESAVIVAESRAVDPDYFDGVLMIGDSLTQTLSIYGTQMRDKAVICAYKSITPDQIVNNVTTEDYNGNQVAVLDEILNQSPHAIYIMLGMNSLASGRSDNLLVYYGRLIDLLRQAYPQVPIYIQSITPVTLDAAIENIQITNRRIRKTNLSLIQLAEEKECWYLDLNSALSDADGNMIAGIHQPDGVHLKAEGCRIWMDYLLTHVAQVQEDKPSLQIPRHSKRGEALWIG